MKKKLILFAILVIINLLVVRFFTIKLSIEKILTIQTFLFALSFLTDMVQKKLSKNKNTTSAYFLVINFTRMVLCFLFLLPVILRYTSIENLYIYNFLIVYFIYLFFDIIFRRKKG